MKFRIRRQRRTYIDAENDEYINQKVRQTMSYLNAGQGINLTKRYLIHSYDKGDNQPLTYFLWDLYGVLDDYEIEILKEILTIEDTNRFLFLFYKA